MPQFDFRQPRLFVEAILAPGESVALERSQSNYLGNVMRLAAGDTILVFNGRDGEWQARSWAASGRKVSRSWLRPGRRTTCLTSLMSLRR